MREKAGWGWAGTGITGKVVVGVVAGEEGVGRGVGVSLCDVSVMQFLEPLC